MRREYQQRLDSIIYDRLENAANSRQYIMTEWIENDKDVAYVLYQNHKTAGAPDTKNFVLYKTRTIIKRASSESLVSKMISDWVTLPVDKDGYIIYPGDESRDPVTGRELPIDKKTGRPKVRMQAVDKDGNPVVVKKRAWMLGDAAVMQKYLKDRDGLIAKYEEALRVKGNLFGLPVP